MRSYRDALVTLAPLGVALVLAVACTSDDPSLSSTTPSPTLEPATEPATSSPTPTPRTATPAPTAPRPTATRPPDPTPLPNPRATPGRFTIQLIDFDSPEAVGIRRGIKSLTATVDGVTCATVDTDVLEPPAIVLGGPDQPEACHRERAWVTLFAGPGELEGERVEHFRLRLGTVALMGNYGPMPAHGLGEPWTGIREYDGVLVFGFEIAAYFAGRCATDLEPLWLAQQPGSTFVEDVIDQSGAPDPEPFGLTMYRARFSGERSSLGYYGHEGQYRYELIPVELRSAELADDCDWGGSGEYRHFRGVWNSFQITNYRFTLQRSCECPPEWSAVTEVTVRNGIVESATIEDGPAPEGAALTIEELFDAIADALNEPATSVVTYDAELGHPLDVQLDLEAIAVDGGFSLTVSDLERLD